MNVKRSYSEIATDVAAAQRGNHAAMDRIIADVQDSVYYTCLSILRSEDAAQDAAQYVLLTVFTRIGTLKNTGAYIGWVNRITANVCKERLSKPNHEVFLTSDEDGRDPFAAFEDVDEQAIPEKALDNAETQRMVVELVNALPDEQRMCVLLFYYDGMKTREIADALDVSEGTVKSRLNYARKTLKNGVEQLERQGNIRLHGVSPIAFLGYWLGRAAKESASPVTAQVIRAAAGHAATAAGTTASGTSAAASAATAGTTAAGTTAGATTAGATATAIGGRILAGILALGITTGIAYGVWHSFDSDPPVIPDEAFSDVASVATPEPTQVPIATAASSAEPVSAQSENVYLYGETRFSGALFTVDQAYRDGSIRVQYENDEMSFVLGGAQFELETEAGTFLSPSSGDLDTIGPKESGYFELKWEDPKGKPAAINVRGIVPQNPDAAFRIAFDGVRREQSGNSDRITGQATYQGMRLTVDQIYTDNGLGKIVLRVQNGFNRIRFGGDARSVRLETDRGDFDASIERTFEPNANETLTVYFDNADGMPARMTIGEVSVLGDDGQPIGSGDRVTIPFSIGDPTAPTPAVPATPTPVPEPVWSEWSLDEPPENAARIETRQMYCKRATYLKYYSFSSYAGDTAEEAEAAIDAAIASDRSMLESNGFTNITVSGVSKNGEDWRYWSKTVSAKSPYTDWILWTGDNNALRSTDGLPDIGNSFYAKNVDFLLRAEYRYSMQ